MIWVHCKSTAPDYLLKFLFCLHSDAASSWSDGYETRFLGLTHSKLGSVLCPDRSGSVGSFPFAWSPQKGQKKAWSPKRRSNSSACCLPKTGMARRNLQHAGATSDLNFFEGRPQRWFSTAMLSPSDTCAQPTWGQISANRSMSDQQHTAASATASLHGVMFCDTDVRERQISTMSSVDFQSLLALSNSFYFL